MSGQVANVAATCAAFAPGWSVTMTALTWGKASAGMPLAGPTSAIRWIEIDPCYVFHPCNSFETDDGQVTLDVVAHATMFDDSRIGPDGKGSRFERWTIDPGARQVTRKLIDDPKQLRRRRLVAFLMRSRGTVSQMKWSSRKTRGKVPTSRHARAIRAPTMPSGATPGRR